MSVPQDVLGVSRARRQISKSTASRARTADARRPDGVSREVFLLTGGRTPASVTPTVALPASSSKPTQKRAWTIQKFENSARTDGLVLSHWVRVGDAPKEYPFAKFNREIRMVTYTDAEYEGALRFLTPGGSGTRKDGGRRAKAVARDQKAAAGADHAAGTTPSVKRGAQKDATQGTATRDATDGGQPGQVQVSSPTRSARRAVGQDRQPGEGERAAGLGPTAPGAADSQEPGRSTANKKAVHYVPPQKEWTKDETDELFSLCQQYDLRFPVIHDRWPDRFANRSIDELKDRYYSMAKAVLDYRAKQDKASLSKLPLALQKHAQAITMNPFDYEYECIRKNQLERQYRRPKEELREEEETVRNARRIEANQKRLRKERERLAKLLAPAGDIKMTAPDGSRVVDAKVAASKAASANPQKVFPHRKPMTGAYPRSSMIYTPVTQSSRLAKRVDQVLEELKVGTRPTPTSHVVDNFDLLRMDILTYLELHRTVSRKEEETHSLRVKLAKLRGETPPMPPPGVVISNKKRRADDAGDPALSFSITGQ